MDQSTLKTTWKQRIIYIIVLVVMVFVFIMSYAGIVMSNKNGNDATGDAKLSALEEEYTNKSNELASYSNANLSGKYLDILKNYRSRVKSYNSNSANTGGLKMEDLTIGNGAELTDKNRNYLAYYIGWCADGSVFDSSFDDYENPTGLSNPLDGSISLIEGWSAGVVGMKIGGVRELTIPGELAYGETQEICGGTNSPLKFVILAIEDEGYKKIKAELDEIYSKIIDHYYSSANASTNASGESSVDTTTTVEGTNE